MYFSHKSILHTNYIRKDIHKRNSSKRKPRGTSSRASGKDYPKFYITQRIWDGLDLNGQVFTLSPRRACSFAAIC